MNRLYISKHIELPKKGGFLLIDDEVPDLATWRRPKIFDPKKHGFNPLKDIDYRKAREIAELLYTLSPEGENTLTVRNGKRALLKALLCGDRLDRLYGKSWEGRPDEEVQGLVGNLLASPLLSKALCADNPFPFKESAIILARVNRKELGEYDALVMGLFLMAQYPGQVVVPDFGFYGRNIHTRLLREERLIAGVADLKDLPDLLHRRVLKIEEKYLKGATLADAEELASYMCKFPRNTEGYDSFIKNAIGAL